MNAQEIQSIVEKLNLYEDYEYVGIRTQEESFELGTIVHESLIWDNGEMTDETLNGISVTDAKDHKALTQHTGEHARSSYFGSNHAIIVSNSLVGYGEDFGEMIVANAKVVYIF